MGKKSFFTVVEFGTSKITVVHCTVGKDGTAEILGFASADSANSVVKGDIVDVSKAEQVLTKVLAAADESVGSYFGRGDVYFLISGRSISSLRGEGCVMIYSADKKITEAHIEEADDKAKMGVPIPADMIDVERFNSYYVLDKNLQVKNPIACEASRLDSVLHIIIVEQTRRNTIRELLHEAGFEKDSTDIFTGVASFYGTLTSDEMENGVLMVDIGAGTIEYAGIIQNGLVASGVIPIGMDNIANDLAIGFDLPLPLTKKMLIDGRIDAAKNAGDVYLEISSVNEVIHREIPLTSIEKIINLRLQETFTILKEELEAKGLMQSFQAGLVLTGGGVKFPAVAELASGVLGCHKRIAYPIDFDIEGMTDQMKDPRYAAVFGAVRYIIEMFGCGAGPSFVKVVDVFENITGGLMNKIKHVTEVFSK